MRSTVAKAPWGMREAEDELFPVLLFSLAGLLGTALMAAIVRDWAAMLEAWLWL